MWRNCVAVVGDTTLRDISGGTAVLGVATKKEVPTSSPKLNILALETVDKPVASPSKQEISRVLSESAGKTRFL